jgi:hypothetical protein
VFTETDLADIQAEIDSKNIAKETFSYEAEEEFVLQEEN